MVSGEGVRDIVDDEVGEGGSIDGTFLGFGSVPEG